MYVSEVFVNFEEKLSRNKIIICYHNGRDKDDQKPYSGTASAVNGRSRCRISQDVWHVVRRVREAKGLTTCT